MPQFQSSTNKNRPASLLAEIEHSGQTTRFDVIKASTDLHTFIILSERKDNTGACVSSVATQCLNQLRRHSVWHQSDMSNISFLYCDPGTGHAARLTPKISASGEIQNVVWNSVPDFFVSKLGVSSNAEADKESRLGIFSQML